VWTRRPQCRQIGKTISINLTSHGDWGIMLSAARNARRGPRFRPERGCTARLPATPPNLLKRARRKDEWGSEMIARATTCGVRLCARGPGGGKRDKGMGTREWWMKPGLCEKIGIRAVKFGGHCRCTIGGEGADRGARRPRPHSPPVAGQGRSPLDVGFPYTKRGGEGGRWRIVIQSRSSDPELQGRPRIAKAPADHF